MSLLNCFAESTTGEVNLATEALGVVIAEPVLEEGSAISVSAVTFMGTFTSSHPFADGRRRAINWVRWMGLT